MFENIIIVVVFVIALLISIGIGRAVAILLGNYIEKKVKEDKE